MNFDLNALVFLLAQNATEKSITLVSVALFAAFLFYLIIDASVKGKLMPKKGPVKKFVIYLFAIAIIALIMLIIFYK